MIKARVAEELKSRLCATALSISNSRHSSKIPAMITVDAGLGTSFAISSGMHATPTVSQAPIQNDPAQTSGAGSADSARPGANSEGFAAALSDAAPTPGRKAAASKAHDGKAAGGPLPVPGNHSPPATLPATSTSTAAASAAVIAEGITGANAASGAASSTFPATAPNGSVLARALGTAANSKSGGAALNPPAGAAAPKALASFTAGVTQALGLPGAERQESGGLGASATELATTAQGAAPKDAAGRQPAVPAVSGLTSAVAAGARPEVAVKPITTAAATAAVAAATSGPSAFEGTASTNTDTTAQTPTAAAMAAAVSGAVAASDAGYADAADSPSSTTDDLATPATDAGAPDAGGANGAALPALALAALAHAAAAAASTAPINAAPVAALAGAGTADKHSQGGSDNSLLTDASGNSIAGAAQMTATVTIAPDASPTPTLKVGAGVDTPEFGQGFADRVSWMVDNNMNGAKLQVNPPQLGPIEVRIAVQGDHAQVWLTSHSAVTRDALEASSPKLREMLGAQGFGQVSVDISQRSFQERSPQAQPYDWTPAAKLGASTTPCASAAISMPRISNSAVDAYA
jgi:flagellar hook-length control protein FliK